MHPTFQRGVLHCFSAVKQKGSLLAGTPPLQRQQTTATTVAYKQALASGVSTACSTASAMDDSKVRQEFFFVATAPSFSPLQR